MTRVDLDAVLKLQKAHCDLQYEVKRAFECVVALTSDRPEPLTLEFENDMLAGLVNMVRVTLGNRTKTKNNK